MLIYFSRINILDSPDLIGLSVKLPLNELCVVLGLGLADINDFFVEGVNVIFFGVDRYFFDHKFLTILVVIGLLDDHSSITIVVPIDCEHFFGES